MKSKALFLDRDGVINKEINYLYRIEDFIFIDGVFELCKKYQNANYKIFVITNQAGISRGFYSEDDYKKLTNWMINEFLKKGITIMEVYHCPHHPEITGECSCRKPNPGMIKQAEYEYSLDLSGSILIGDKMSDIEAGKNAGVGLNVLIIPNNIPVELSSVPLLLRN
jgi:D-glycero-D-manno-heptose 1,7-bisphosphate phosphatase